MYSLPYVLVEKNKVIPLPGCSYSFTLSRNTVLKTHQFKTDKNKIESAFVILFTHKGKVLEKGVLCLMLEQLLHQDSITINFTSLKEIKRINNDSFCNFTFYEKPKSTTYKKYIKYVLQHIAASDLFFEFPFVSLLLEEYSFTSLNKFLTFLEIDDAIVSEYFFTNDLFKKITIVYDSFLTKLAFIEYEKEPLEDLDKSYPDYVLDTLAYENQKLNSIPKTSNEHHTVAEYISFVESLPWLNKTQSKIKIRDLKKELNETHYGLLDVKEYILDYFASLQYSKTNSGIALLFDGPPGTGKTTIAKSIAKAMNRDCIFISLAGVDDESEIRGHRRTYIASRAGRILSALSKINSINPVIILDEIDKLSSNHKGNPKAALLELLDFEQNTAFVDRYLEIPIDLSSCIFIATSNYKKNIDPPLLDRLFEIKFDDYTFEEKHLITINKIIPKLNDKYKIKETHNIIFKDSLLTQLSKDKDLRQITKFLDKLYMKACRKFLSKHKEVTFDLTCYKQKIKSGKIGFI